MKGEIQGLVRLCLCQCKLDKGNVNYTCVKLIKKSNKLIFPVLFSVLMFSKTT